MQSIGHIYFLAVHNRAVNIPLLKRDDFLASVAVWPFYHIGDKIYEVKFAEQRRLDLAVIAHYFLFYKSFEAPFVVKIFCGIAPLNIPELEVHQVIV